MCACVCVCVCVGGCVMLRKRIRSMGHLLVKVGFVILTCAFIALINISTHRWRTGCMLIYGSALLSGASLARGPVIMLHSRAPCFCAYDITSRQDNIFADFPCCSDLGGGVHENFPSQEL